MGYKRVKSLKILIADDAERLRERLKSLLSRVTGSNPDVRQLCRDAGADDFVEKSVGFMGAAEAVQALTAGGVA